MHSHDIEPITPENWVEAASALCRAAMTFETMLVKCLEKHPDLADELISPNVDDFRMQSAVVGHWREFLEITDGTGEP